MTAINVSITWPVADQWLRVDGRTNTHLTMVFEAVTAVVESLPHFPNDSTNYGAAQFCGLNRCRNFLDGGTFGANWSPVYIVTKTFFSRSRYDRTWNLRLTVVRPARAIFCKPYLATIA